jgi:hypothetical protein
MRGLPEKIEPAFTLDVGEADELIAGPTMSRAGCSCLGRGPTTSADQAAAEGADGRLTTHGRIGRTADDAGLAAGCRDTGGAHHPGRTGGASGTVTAGFGSPRKVNRALSPTDREPSGAVRSTPSTSTTMI